MQMPAPQAPVVAGTPVAEPPAPRTVQDILVLRARRNELSSQLQSAAGRRRSLASELNNTADPAARAGLESRIGVLDKRMVQLESDIAETGRQLSSGPAALISTTEAPMTFFSNPQVAAPLTGAFIVFVLGPLAIGAARMMWKRSSRPALPPVAAQSAERLRRLEESVDAIAVEVERISEGQRFVTKLLSEAPQAAIGAGEKVSDTVRNS